MRGKVNQPGKQKDTVEDSRMPLGPGAIFDAIVSGLMVSVFIKMAVTGIVALVVSMSIYPKPTGRSISRATPIMAVAGSVAFQLFMYIPGGFLGVLIGTGAFWLVVTFTMDHYFEVHYDQSYAHTLQIVGISLVVWLIIGFAISLIRMVS